MSKSSVDMAEASGFTMYNKTDTSLLELDSNSKATLKFLNPGVEYAFGWNQFNLRLIGLWPEQTCKDSQTSLIMKYSAPIWVLWILSFAVGPTAMAPMVYSFPLEELIQIVCSIAGIVGSCVKLSVLWNNGEVLAWCLSFLSKDWTRKSSTKERELMIRNARLCRTISVGSSILMHSLAWSYVFLKILPLFYLKPDVWNSTDIGKVLMYPSYFPFDLRKPSNFAFALIGQFFATFVATFAYTAVDCFIALLIIHLCGQISILHNALVNLLDNEKSLGSENYRKKLAVIVKRHETLIEFARVIEDAVNLMLLILTLNNLVLFCLQMFGLMTTVTERKPGTFPFVQVAFFISYISVTMIHLFLYCYVGDMLIEESKALGLASYSCKWYNLTGRDAKDLMIVMQRARSPLEISAGKFVVFSLQLFSNVLKTTMSYFSVLLTMKESA